jgi:uncharacterized membrane protein
VRARRAVRRATLLLSCKLARGFDALLGILLGIWFADGGTPTAVVVLVVAVAAVVMPLPRKADGG